MNVTYLISVWKLVCSLVFDENIYKAAKLAFLVLIIAIYNKNLCLFCLYYCKNEIL